MKTCCTSDCAYHNDCIIGGYECRRCGRSFCAGDIRGDLCDDCRREIEREKREYGEEER